MRILHLIPTLGGGGAERQIAYLAHGLQARGCDVHVGIASGGPNLERLLATGATVHWIRTRGNYDPLLLPRIVRLVRRVRPDIVQTWLTRMDVVGGAAALITGSLWIVSERSSGTHYPRDARHKFRRAIGRYASAIVANAEVGLGFWRSSRVAKFVIPNALAFEAMEAVAPATDEVGAGKVILFGGRFGEEKNVLNLIDALAVAMAGRDVVAVLCGTGPLEAAIRARIDRLGLADRIRLPGYVDPLWSWLKRADVLVAASWFEGHPNVVLEAAACGCPLVLSDIAAHRDLFDEKSADFVPPSDVSAMAAAIARALDDPESAHARAAVARNVVSRLSISAAADAYLGVYEWLMASPQSDAPVHRH